MECLTIYCLRLGMVGLLAVQWFLDDGCAEDCRSCREWLDLAEGCRTLLWSSVLAPAHLAFQWLPYADLSDRSWQKVPTEVPAFQGFMVADLSDRSWQYVPF